MLMTDTASLVVDSAKGFYQSTQEDDNARYLSWEHCYKCFHDARTSLSPDYDYLSLQLGFYLASWGMYRASSFLLQKDYKVHTEAVKEILSKKYNCLLDLECAAIKDTIVQSRLNELYDALVSHYDPIRQDLALKSRKHEKVDTALSATLITKIMMGTLGCVPAYDRFFSTGVKLHKIASGTYSIKSLVKLSGFYEENKAPFEEVRQKMFAYGLPYPQMKLLDMGFWQIGYDHEEQERQHSQKQAIQ